MFAILKANDCQTVRNGPTQRKPLQRNTQSHFKKAKADVDVRVCVCARARTCLLAGLPYECVRNQ